MSDIEPRKGMPSPKLDETEFRRRFLSRFADPAFASLASELDSIAGVAWQAYKDERKSPRTRKAGPGYADPDYDIATDWLDAKAAIAAAQQEYEDETRPPRVLLINASSRSEHTCPGEMSKSWRLIKLAQGEYEAGGVDTEILDLSRLASEFGREIHPCKGCFSTAAALCHWPCSCYPNYSLGQTHDWMNAIYPMWVRAHGVMIIGPVNWYQATSPLKLMIDRMVCADGGNPDPSSTHGKKAIEAKALELNDWPYPQHLKGRLFSLAIHGDVEGVENVRRALTDWLRFMGLCSAGPHAELDRYIGYWKPYATSHKELDEDLCIQGEVKNAARTLMEAVKGVREGTFTVAGQDLEPPRKK